jgi:hypothetical protein
MHPETMQLVRKIEIRIRGSILHRFPRIDTSTDARLPVDRSRGATAEQDEEGPISADGGALHPNDVLQRQELPVRTFETHTPQGF